MRHNLCFSSSFEKTTDFVCLEGNRKSRLWKLTTEGRRKFQEEAQALPEDMMGLVHQSMDKPGGPFPGEQKPFPPAPWLDLGAPGWGRGHSQRKDWTQHPVCCEQAEPPGSARFWEGCLISCHRVSWQTW